MCRGDMGDSNFTRFRSSASCCVSVLLVWESIVYGRLIGLLHHTHPGNPCRSPYIAESCYSPILIVFMLANRYRIRTNTRCAHVVGLPYVVEGL